MFSETTPAPARENGATAYWLAAAVALIVALLAAWPLFAEPGLLNTRGGGDSPFLLQRLHQLTTAIADGHFPARWMPDANYGYGYPFYNYYAPLSIYIAAFFRLLGFTYVGAIKMAQLSGFLVAAGGMYALVWRWWRRPAAALLAATAYTLAPFHLVNVYVRGDSLAEFWAMAFYPLVLLALERVGTAEGPKRRRAIICLGAAYAGLVLSHNISALIFSPFLLLYGLLRWPVTTIRPRLPHLAAGALLGLGLSAWFWLPALAETGLAQTDPITEGYFHYSQHFRGANLVQSDPLFNYDVGGGRAFRMGAVQALLTGAGLLAAAYLLWQRRSRPLLLGLLIFGVATFMITPLSRRLWDIVPLLPFTQFPWRFLSVQGLGGAVLVSALGLLPGRRATVPLLILLLLGSSLLSLETEHLPLSDADVTATRLAQYEWFTGNIGTTVSAEYLPRTVQPRPRTGALVETGAETAVLLFAGAGSGTATRTIDRTQQQVWQITATHEAIVVLPTLAWPGWKARLDEEQVDITPAPSSGLVSVPVPAGTHELELRLTRPPVRLAAEWLSLLVLLVGVVLYLATGPRPAWPAAVAVLGGLLLLAILVRLWPAYDPAGPRSWDFAQLGYLHPAPAGIPFANDSLLQDYVYSSAKIGPGATWTVTLTWADPPTGQTLLLDLVTPAQTRPALTRQVTPPAVTKTSALVGGATTTLTMTVPLDTPAGLFLPRLRLVDQAGQPISALTGGGQTRGDLYLAPLRVVRDGANNPLTEALPAGGARLDLRPLALSRHEGAAGTALYATVGWWTPAPLVENYHVSLRLSDSAGLLVAQLDTAPGFGFNPSSLWPAGAWQPDRLALPLPPPAETAGTGPYAFTIRLYDVASGRAVLTRRLGQLNHAGGQWMINPSAPVYEVPAGITPYLVRFDDRINLRGYQLAQEDEFLNVTLYWQALRDGLADYAHFVHLVDPATGVIVSQHDAQPQNGTYPSSQWVAGEVVADRARLDVATVPPGTYQLTAGLYRPVSPFPRLPLTNGADHVLLGTVTVE